MQVEAVFLELVLAFLSGGGAVALVGLIRYLINLRQRRQRMRIPAVLLRMHAAYSRLNLLLSSTTAHRIMVLRAENGGSIPAFGKDLYSSVVFEVFDGVLGPKRDRWQRQLLEPHYVKTLMDVALEGTTIIKRSELPDGALKQIYEADGIHMEQVYSIYAEPGAFYYMMLSFTEEVDLVPDVLDLIRVVRNDLRNIFEEDRRGS